MHVMIRPGYLKESDRIALVAPAGKIAPETIEQAIHTLNNWGLAVVTGKHLLGEQFQYAASDADRTRDLQDALDDADIRAVLCARGGYGSIRIVDALNFERFRENPKWVIGFSDITILHAHIHRHFGIETIHGPMAAGLGKEDPSSASLQSILFGKAITYEIPNHPLNRMGRGTGQLIGGNLAILAGLLGSDSEVNTEGKILFLEEVGENLYRIDRMMWSMKRAGKLQNLSGLIVGGMTGIPDSPKDFGKDAYGIISEHVTQYTYPVCFNFPAGHQADNRALIFGRKVTLEVDKSTRIVFNPEQASAT